MNFGGTLVNPGKGVWPLASVGMHLLWSHLHPGPMSSQAA